MEQTEFTKEEIKTKVHVPEGVETELYRLIEEKLNQCGVFYRVFSRIKKAASLERKLKIKSYGEDKKIQDLVGVRINLYFQDDIKIVKSLMEKLFYMVDDWVVKKHDTNNFESMKINGVFRMPAYLVAKISEETWELPIDQTFEIQIRTVFFEGWHEVEHDMRYKNEAIWEEYENYSRRFNSIVATLELCDRSMLDLFEDFAYRMYKEQNWEGMLRMHYRLRLSEQPLYEEFIPILEDDANRIGKALLKMDRKVIVDYLADFSRDIPISVNMIVSILNARVDYLQDQRIIDIGKKHKVYHDGLQDHINKHRKNLKPMNRYKTYSNRVSLDYTKENKEQVFELASQYMYNWARDKFIPIFPEFNKKKEEQNLIAPGYSVRIELNSDEFVLDGVHIDNDVAGRVWNTKGHLYFKDNRLYFEVSNEMMDVNDISEEERINNFNAPYFCNRIFNDDRLAVRDIRKLRDSAKLIKGEKKPEKKAYELIMNSQRQHPVVIIVCNINDDEKFDDAWLGNYWSGVFAGKVRYISHVYMSAPRGTEELKGAYAVDGGLKQGVYLFDSKGYTYYSREEIENWKQIPGDSGIIGVRSTEGKDAFMDDLVRKIKSINIS